MNTIGYRLLTISARQSIRVIPKITFRGPAWARSTHSPRFSRSMQTLDFGGTKEIVVERSDYPREKLQKFFKDDTMAVIGYGVQGRAQSQNMRDNGLNVVIGIRKSSEPNSGWVLAKKDGWVEGKTLLSIEEAAKRGTVVLYLLSDAGQKQMWDVVKPFLTKGKTLFFLPRIQYRFQGSNWDNSSEGCGCYFSGSQG